MKIIFKKLKKANTPMKIFYFITLLLYLGSYIYFIKGLLILKIATVFRVLIIVFFGIWFLIYLFGGLVSLLTKKVPSFVFTTVISMLCCPVFILTSYFIHTGYGWFADKVMQMNRNEIEYTSNLIALKETNFSSGSLIGMIETEDDISGNQLAHILLEKNNLKNEIKYYEDYIEMISDLLNGKIDACFVSGEFAITFKNEAFEEIGEDETPIPLEDRVKILYTYKELRKNQDVETLEESKTKKLTEPFSILIMGVDSENDGLKANQSFNGDTLILITFNPDTLTATMLSIPRDTYVPIACNRNRYNKINSSAAYGSSCVISTVQQLTDIKIDFYVKVNFKGVVDLVDALGGVTVDVEKPNFNYNHGVNCHGQFCEQNSNREFGDKMIYLDPGVQKLNGEQALAYARNRHQYALSDIARNQHQQDIILAMTQELKNVSSFEEFENILDTIAKNIETNLTTDQILSFYDVGKNIILSSKSGNHNSVSVKKTYLTYYGLTVWNGYNASALGYYPESLKAITKAMKVNLGLEKEEDIKTFSFSYNENYKTPLIGERLYGGEVLKTLPNHVGYDKETVQTWCLNNGISCNFVAVDSPSNYGQVIEQSVHANSLLKTVSEVTFKYSNASQQVSNKPTTDKPSNGGSNSNNKDDKDDKDKDNNKDNNNNKDDDDDYYDIGQTTGGGGSETPTPTPTEPEPSNNEEE